MLEFLFVVLLCTMSLSSYAGWGYVKELRKKLAERQAVIQDQQRRLRILENCLKCSQANFHELDMEYERLLMLHQGLGPVQRTWSEDMDKATTAD